MRSGKMKRFFAIGAVLAIGVLPEAQAALMNSFTLKPGAHKSLTGGDLRVCNDAESASSATVQVRDSGMVYLQPGRCMNEWGMMLTFVNDGKEPLTIRYRSISKNNGRVPGHH
jgi:hypothetical protein